MGEVEVLSWKFLHTASKIKAGQPLLVKKLLGSFSLCEIDSSKFECCSGMVSVGHSKFSASLKHYFVSYGGLNV